MINHVGKEVILYWCAVVKHLKFVLAMAKSIVIKHFTSEVFECLRLNNTIKDLNTEADTVLW
jgi:hypothetical protein